MRTPANFFCESDMGDNLLTLFSMLPLVLLASLAEFLIMSVTWKLAMSEKNAGWVDVAWSGSFAILALFYSLLATGYSLRRFAIATMVIVWGTRLAIHLFIRTRHEKREDKRYAEMRESWGESAEQNFFALFQFQALTVIVLAWPFLVSASDKFSQLRPTEYAGIAMFIASFVGEVLADRQLRDFKADKANQGEVCDRGLWSYSRHPNYFFEWLIWCSFFLFAVQSPYGMSTLISPVIMLVFLTKVSGVPLAEKQSLASKGEKYVAYQKRTSPFIPWFPRGT